MVNTVYQLQYILSKYIPSNDDSFDDSHKKHIVINRINKLINNITNSLHDKDVDEVISILEKLDDVSKSKGDD
ncbi:hypothetical protein FD27_GL001212 [Limosilactobacillus frumenti DSM 13145]|uniref:Uncharacterized protein n=2 Tax=Limosilactobacillus frumenti TaxID=104955 RepID=A0A0R1P5R6_9LACO|nr:hypothetical protein FD27_GL001212 [Limosilactobacillus frumenti DSM 13145]